MVRARSRDTGRSGGTGRSRDGRHSRDTRGTRVGRLFRRADRWQKAVAVLCALVAAHGVYVLFVPPVQLDGSDLTCPPAVVAAIAGRGGVETVDDPEVAARHDAACAATGQRWLVAGGLQVGLAVVWGLATLEWARVLRRRRRRRRRRSRERRQSAGSAEPEA